MKLHTLASVALSALLGVAIAGCDETVSEKKSTEVKPDGTKVEKSDTTKKDDEGNVTREKKTEVDAPGDANDKETVEKKEVKND